MLEKDERMYAMLIYLVSIFFPVLGPLIIWLIKREESDFVDYHGKEYFNFLISYTVYSVISGILVVLIIGIALLAIVGILAFIFTLVALVKANNGERYRIPLVFRLIK